MNFLQRLFIPESPKPSLPYILKFKDNYWDGKGWSKTSHHAKRFYGEENALIFIEEKFDTDICENINFILALGKTPY